MFSTLTKIPCWTLFGLALFLLFLLHEANADNRIEVAGDGTDVILIPGLASDGAALRSVTEHLGQCHRTHTLTLAGFAGQPAVDGRLAGHDLPQHRPLGRTSAAGTTARIS